MTEDATGNERPADAQLERLETLIGELEQKVGELRAGELDAATLEARLRELNDLAGRAAAALDSATR